MQGWLLQARHVHMLALREACQHLVGVCLAVLTLHAGSRRAVLKGEVGSELGDTPGGLLPCLGEHRLGAGHGARVQAPCCWAAQLLRGLTAQQLTWELAGLLWQQPSLGAWQGDAPCSVTAPHVGAPLPLQAAGGPQQVPFAARCLQLRQPGWLLGR